MHPRVTAAGPAGSRTEAAAAAVEAVLSRGHLLRRRVRGFSMAPCIRDGDQIVLAAADPEMLRAGDVIQFLGPDGLRVHRILAVHRGADGLRFRVAGDRSEAADPPVSAELIRGRVVAVLREGHTLRLDRRSMRMRARLRAWRGRLGRSLRGRTHRMTAAEEAQVLRAFVRAAFLPGEPPQMPALDDAGWAQVAAAGIRGGVGPLLHAALLAHPGSLACPEAVSARLRAARLATLVQYAARGRELGRILATLQAEQIPILVVKGAALAETAYPDPALRPMHDVDLLVRPADRHRARAALLSIGYEDVTRGPEDFWNPTTGLDIDLHTELVNATRLPSRRSAWRADLDAFWGRAITARVASITVRVPDPVDHFVYLAQHLMLHHGMDGALRFADLLALGLHLDPGPGWGAVVRAAREAQAGHSVFLALAYLRDGFCLDIQEAALAAVAPSWPQPVRTALRALTLNHRLAEDAKFLFALLALPSWRERTAFLQDILFPTADAMGGRLGIPRGLWRRRLGHAGHISQVLWGAARRVLRV